MMFEAVLRVFIFMLLGLAVVISSPVASHAESEPSIRVAIAHWPPWKVIKDGEFSGIDVEILRAIEKKGEWKFSFAECVWRRCVEMVKTGDVDMVTSFGKNPEREKFADFLNPPYASQKVAFYKNKNSSVKVEDYQDLHQYKIGKILGSVYFDTFDNDPELRIEQVKREDQLLKMLIAKRIDLVVGYEHAVDYAIALLGLSENIKKMPYVVRTTDSYIGVAKKSVIRKHIPELNRVLDRMVKRGEINAIIKSYFEGLEAEAR